MESYKLGERIRCRSIFQKTDLCFLLQQAGYEVVEEPNLVLCITDTPKEQPDYWQNITEMAQKQRNKGLATYGQTLEQNTALSATERITMAQEELIDALMYLEHLKEVIE